VLFLLELQTYEALVRGKRRAEERAVRAAEKASKEESKRQEELRSYKGLMRVSGNGQVPCIV
jgi:tRNA(Ser,Leu) C12 N-acetylase TAN1